jgi:hypothetical protein
LLLDGNSTGYLWSLVGFLDRDGQRLTREETHRIPPEQLGRGSGITLNILPDVGAPYYVVADIMMEVILR